MEKKRALQLVSFAEDKYKYLDCYTKQTSCCTIIETQGKWAFQDESHPDDRFIINGKCSPTDIDIHYFINKLPVISKDNFDDLLGDGTPMRVGIIIESIEDCLQERFDTINDWEIIVIERL